MAEVETAVDVRQPLVLVADDEPDIRDLVAIRLARASYRVATARDGAEAMERAVELQPDLIVLDVNMPGQDGFETSRRLREDPRTSHVPVVFLTARTREQDVVTGYARGGDGYVTKPFEPHELLERVDALVGVGRMRALAD
ncbi:MAG: response regulator [Actinomycetota bacterium]|nr:response regulator [Actinomycetota bacterium]